MLAGRQIGRLGRVRLMDASEYLAHGQSEYGIRGTRMAGEFVAKGVGKEFEVTGSAVVVLVALIS